MIANAQRRLQAATSLAALRTGFALVLVAQLFVLREVSEGRFALLSRGGEAVSELWYLHTFSKVMLLSSSALLIGALVERRFGQPSLLSRGWVWSVSVLHGGALIVLLMLMHTLPIGFEASLMADMELWRYGAISCAFLFWQWTAVLLIGPRMLVRGMRLRTIVFLLCAMSAAVFLSSGNSAVVNFLRTLVEDTTLSLALAFYTLIGSTEPVLSLRDGTPLLSAPGFAILIGAPCAGYQGLLASASLMAGLIILDWPTLRHGRALILGLVTVVGVFVLNSVRIALLFHIGVSYSSVMAIDGFHSYFGTLSLLLVVGVAMLAMQHRSFRQTGRDMNRDAEPTFTNSPIHWGAKDGMLILPLAIYLGIGMVLGLFIAGFNWTYPLLAASGLGLMALWRDQIGHEFSGGLSLTGFSMGVVIYLLWMAMVPSDPTADAAFAVELHSVPMSLMIGWIVFRLIGFSIVVPVLEELTFRGGLHRLINGKLSPFTGERAAALFAFTLSSLAFGYMHANFIAGTIAGAGFGLLVLRSGRIGDAIIAHAVTNLLLAMTAMVTSRWSLW